MCVFAVWVVGREGGTVFPQQMKSWLVLMLLLLFLLEDRLEVCLTKRNVLTFPPPPEVLARLVWWMCHSLPKLPILLWEETGLDTKLHLP